MTAFFVPGGLSPAEQEARYIMERNSRLDTTGHRVESLSATWNGDSQYYEVGKADPVDGGTVLMIFERTNGARYEVVTELRPGIMANADRPGDAVTYFDGYGPGDE